MIARHSKTQSIILYLDAQPRLFRYGLAALAVATAAIATRYTPVIGQRAAFMFFFFAIIQTAYWLGRNPGFFALLLSFIAVNAFVLVPSWISNPYDVLILNTGFFALSLVFITTTSQHRSLTTALWESRQDLDRAQAIGKIGNWRMDVQRNELRWSDENHRIFGISKGTPLTYEAFLATVHPKDREYVDVNWQAALRGEQYDIEHRIIVKGEVKWVRERAELEFDGKGLLLGGFGTTQDITDLKHIQQELLDIQLRYAGVIESSMDAMITIDSGQRILLFNAAAEKMFGCKAGEAFGKPVSSFIPERFQHAHGKHIGMFADTGVTNRKMGKLGTVIGLRTNGEEFPVEASISQCDINGKKLFTAILRDITDRKIAEDELRNINVRYELVLHGAQDAIWDWDVAHKRVHYSTRWKALRGLSDNEVSDREEEWSDHIHPDDKERVFAALKAHFDGKTEFFCEEYQIRCKDGSWKWILDRGIAERDNYDQVIRMAGSESDITYRKLAEQALQHQENELRLIMDATPALISYLDTDFKYLRVNKTYENWFCIHREDILGRTARDIIGEKAWDIVSPYLERARSGERVSFDYQIPYGTGKPRWVHGNYIPDKDENGNIKGIVVHVTDIDDRKQAESALLESEERLQQAKQAAALGIYDHDLVSGAMQWDDRIRGLWGVKPDETPTLATFMSRLHPDDSDNVKAAAARSFDPQGHGEYQVEYRIIRPNDNKLFWVATFGITTFANGCPIRLVGFVQDITERKQNERTLRDYEARLALVVEEVKASYWDWDLTTNRLYLSPEWNRQLGLEDNDLLLHWDRKNDRLHPDDRARVTEETENYILGRQPNFELEFRLRHKDGTYRWIHSRGVLLRDQENRPYRMLGLNLDITDYKREKELNERRGEMEKSFQLYVATQTAAAIAHELNQPLTAISYYAYVAQDALKAGNQNPQKLAMVMEKCAEQAQRAGDVIQQLLSLLHKGETISEPVDINKSVNYAIDFVKAQGYFDGYKIELNLAPDLPMVMANALQVQKVLVNLLNNGLESMTESGKEMGTLSVTSCLSPNNPALVLVSVRDSGMGVPDIDSLNKMFQPFYTTKKRGLGMGLAISRALVEAHGGKMWAEQNADCGITVHFTLPIVL